jgi:hypothetical protein
MRTSCHVTSQWVGAGTKAAPWRPQLIVDHPACEYDMLTAGDPRSDPQVPVDLLVRCPTDEAWTELQGDAAYTPTEIVQYSNSDDEGGDPLW